MTDQSSLLKLTPLSPSFGVEVSGIDLSQPISGELGADLRSLFFKHHLLLFRDQHFEVDKQIAFMSLINKVIHEPEIPVVEAVKVPLAERFTYVSNTSKGTYGPANDEYIFHADMSWTPQGAIQAISLYAEEMENPAPTAFANMINAVKKCPDELQQRVHGLLVENTSPFDASFRANSRARLSKRPADAPNSDYPHAAHEVISYHPVTGEKFLASNPMHTSHIVGWDDKTSDALFAELDRYAYVPENIYVHHWKLWDFIAWDNIGLQHRRDAIPGVGKRTLRRVMANPYELGELFAAAEAPDWKPARKYGKDATMIYKDGRWQPND